MGSATIASSMPVSAGTSAAPRLVIVDDDQALARVLALRLDGAGWAHERVVRPPTPAELVGMRLSALLIDLDLAGQGRWSYLDRIAAALPALAILVCTRPWPVADRVSALRNGADAWISKPCHPDELFARICAAVRARRGASTTSGNRPQTVGELELHRHRYTATAGGRDLQLTRREFELLVLLVESGDEVLEREAIYRRIWGYEMARGDRSVDVFIRRLRQKLAHASPGWRYLHTHFGVGYSFQAQPAPEPASRSATDAPAPRSGTPKILPRSTTGFPQVLGEQGAPGGSAHPRTG